MLTIRATQTAAEKRTPRMKRGVSFEERSFGSRVMAHDRRFHGPRSTTLAPRRCETAAEDEAREGHPLLREKTRDQIAWPAKGNRRLLLQLVPTALGRHRGDHGERARHRERDSRERRCDE